jgi:hypothetical protein
MSAITLAEKKIGTVGPGPTVFAFVKFLTNRYEVTDPNIPHVMVTVEDILQDSETEAFIKELGKMIKPNTTRKKKKSTNDEGRVGQYDGGLCDARLWKEKPTTGGLGYDNIQCSSKKVDGCDCLCKKHFKLQGEGKLWTGLITEVRPEEPKKPDGTRMFWSTDKDGNDVVKEKKKKKTQVKKPKKPENKSPEDMDFEELTKYMEDLKIKKEAKEEKAKEEAKEKENVSDMPKPHPDGAFAKKEKEEKKKEEAKKEEAKKEEAKKEEAKKEEAKKEEENGDDGWANDTEELSDGEDDEGYKEELNKEGQLVETAPPLDQVIGMDEEKEEEKKKPEKEPKKEPKKKEPKKEPKKKKKFDITKFEPEPEKGYEEDEDLELDDGEESDEEESLKLVDIEGVEYQINFEDNRVIRVDDFEDVGMWNCETESIDFDEDE